MDSFFRETENEEFNIRRITKGGFSKSRRNLAPEAFLELNDIVWRGFYKQVDYLGYHGHKLLAVDGTFLNLPNHESIHQEFGIRDMGRGQNKDVPKSMCLLSMLYDPVNYLNLDVQMGETDGSELQLLLKHLPKIDKGDIVMLDRGYPSRYLFSILVSKGSHFIVRMKPNWLPVKEFIKSRKKDITVTMEVPDGDFERYRKEFPAMRKTVKCRMVKVRAESGEEQILCTSLLDPVKYKLQELGELYCIRWGIEEGYKMYKAQGAGGSLQRKNSYGRQAGYLCQGNDDDDVCGAGLPDRGKGDQGIQGRTTKRNGEVSDARSIAPSPIGRRKAF